MIRIFVDGSSSTVTQFKASTGCAVISILDDSLKEVLPGKVDNLPEDIRMCGFSFWPGTISQAEVMAVTWALSVLSPHFPEISMYGNTITVFSDSQYFCDCSAGVKGISANKHFFEMFFSLKELAKDYTIDIKVEKVPRNIEDYQSVADWMASLLRHNMEHALEETSEREGFSALTLKRK